MTPGGALVHFRTVLFLVHSHSYSVNRQGPNFKYEWFIGPTESSFEAGHKLIFCLTELSFSWKQCSSSRSTLWTGRELLIQNASGENAALKAGLISPGFHLLLDICPVIFNFPDRSLMISNQLKTNTHTCAHNTSPVFLVFLGIRVGPNYLVCCYWKWVSIISVVFLHMPSELEYEIVLCRHCFLCIQNLTGCLSHKKQLLG